jgi:glycosyltransferase involved in cell wall biosynthesis
MRVAVNAWFWDNPTTGSGQYTRRLVAHLNVIAPNLEIVLVAPGRRWFQFTSFEFQASGQPEPVTLNLKPETGGLGKVWFEQIAFPRACRRLGADVAHVPYWAPPLASSIPTVVTIHDLIPLLLPAYRGGPLVRLYTALVGRAAHSAALVLTDSQASRRDIVAHLGLRSERVRVVYLAADERYAPPSSNSPLPGGREGGGEPSPPTGGSWRGGVRARYDLPSRYVLYLGGFDVRKNVATVLAAYRQAGPVIGEMCPLVVAGRLPERDTPFTPDPRRLAREQGVDERFVRFIGFVEEADKPALYQGATAFIFPSRYEGFGLPPLEALACGTPVVGSNAASIPEVVGPGGVLLPPDDAEGMARALIRLATDEGFREELSRHALVQVARFSWERTARETLVAYRDVVT